MNESDLRVQRTRRLLREAFLKLANERDFADITIRDVTRTAQVGYKTFFRHYDSIDALLQATIDHYLAEFDRVALPATEVRAIEENTRYVLQLVRKNRQLFLAIFNSPKAATFLRPVMAHAYRDSVQLLSGSDVPNELVGYHFARSMLSLLEWWIRDNAHYSDEAMLDYIMRLVVRPMEKL